MRTARLGQLAVLLDIALLAGCSAAVSPARTAGPRDQGSTLLLLTFRATPDQPSDGIPGFQAACPLKVEHPSDGAQLLLRRAIQRDSVEGSDADTVRYPRALGDYEPLTRGALGLGRRDWLRLDCQTLRSVAVVPRDA